MPITLGTKSQLLSTEPSNTANNWECAFKFLSAHGLVTRVNWDKGTFKEEFPGLGDDLDEDNKENGAVAGDGEAYMKDLHELKKKFPMTYDEYRASKKKKQDKEQRKKPEGEQLLTWVGSYGDESQSMESDEIAEVDGSALKSMKALVVTVDDDMANAMNKKLFLPPEVLTTPSKSRAMHGALPSKTIKRKADAASTEDTGGKNKEIAGGKKKKTKAAKKRNKKANAAAKSNAVDAASTKNAGGKNKMADEASTEEADRADDSSSDEEEDEAAKKAEAGNEE
jgi:hypothetical protein